MECKNDEAVRAKQIAEQKLLERDITGAKKFALKAQSLSPKLECLSQFLEIIDVYASHEKKINGELDYYGILGVDPSANEEVLKKQYKRKVLSLHSAENKSVGADGAFKILSQAWNVLSDINQRTAYNSKLSVRAANYAAGIFCSSSAMYTTPANSYGFPTRPTKQEIFTTRHYNCKASGSNGAHVPNYPKTPTHAESNPILSRFPHPVPNFEHALSRTTSGHCVPPSVSPFHPQAPYMNQPTFNPHPPSSQTFWTMCNRCCSYFEFGRNYLNQIIMCFHCHVPFSATAMPPPKVNYASPNESASGGGCLKQSGPDVIEKTETANGAVMENNRVVPEQMKVDAASNCVSSMKKREKVVKKRHKNIEIAGDEASCGRPGPNRAAAKRNGIGAKWEFKTANDFSLYKIRTMLVRKATIEIQSLLSDWEAVKPKSSYVKNVQINGAANLVMTEKTGNAFKSPKNTVLSDKPPSLDEPDDMDSNADETVSMVVPDANFHNFDDDRIEDSFSENQVWAAYDNDDGMPRYYALVHRVISRKPFKMEINWLNSQSCSEYGSLDWIGSGFTKTSGDYRTGKHVVNMRLNSFSHPSKWKKGPRGVIQVLPTKGDVWAMYTNWSPQWVDQDTTDEIIHKYDVVVVLEDYRENVGIVVARLSKVAGFISVFDLDKSVTHTIPREEMFRFSHQVPFYILSGFEAGNSPKGCYELDPAALPLELLKVMTDTEASEQRVQEAVSETTLELTTTGDQKKRGVEGVKIILTYSRRKKRKQNKKEC